MIALVVREIRSDREGHGIMEIFDNSVFSD